MNKNNNLLPALEIEVSDFFPPLPVNSFEIHFSTKNIRFVFGRDSADLYYFKSHFEQKSMRVNKLPHGLDINWN